MDPLILGLVVLALIMTLLALVGMALAYWHISRNDR